MDRNEALDLLRQASDNGNLIPVIGAGYSMATANLPSWAGLLSDGLAFCDKHAKALCISGPVIEQIRDAEAKQDLLRGFSLLRETLNASTKREAYSAWLDTVFREKHAYNHKLSAALKSLGCRTLVTTNIDLLLEREKIIANSNVATWLNWREMLHMLRGRGGIIHLHGRFDQIDSVVLSQDDYDRLVSSGDKGEIVARTLFYSGVLLFIGTSPAGVSDPHLSRLLQPFSELHGPVLAFGSTSPHFLFGRDDMHDLERSRLRGFGIEPVLYHDHADLPNLIAAISRRSMMVPVSGLPEFTNTLVSHEHLEDRLESVGAYIKNHVLIDEPFTISFFQKSSTWRNRAFLRLRWPLKDGPRHRQLPYPLSIAAWSMIIGRIIVYTRFGEDDSSKRDVEAPKKRGLWDAVRKEILSALKQTKSAPKPKEGSTEGKSRLLVANERMKELSRNMSESVRGSQLEAAIGLDTCPVTLMYHAFQSQNEDDELHRNFSRTIICIPVPEKSQPRSSYLNAIGVICIDFPRGLQNALSRGQLDNLAFVSDCTCLAMREKT